MKRLKVLSICGGIETGLLALQELGIPIEEYHTYEILPEAIAVSSYHFPWIIHHGNVIGTDFNQFKGFDLVIAGTCCQSLSRLRIDNKEINSGLDGKSKIFFEFVRALEAIKPRWFMLENVIPSDDNDLKTMNDTLGTAPQLINSNLFSAQDRERYYWTNFEIPVLPTECNIVLKDIMETDVDEKYFYEKPYRLFDINKKVCGELYVNTTEMCKRIYNPKFKMATLTCINGGYQEKKIYDNGRVRKATEVEYERLQTLPDNYTNVILNGKRLSYTKRCSLCGNGWNKETVKHIFKGLLQYI